MSLAGKSEGLQGSQRPQGQQCAVCGAALHRGAGVCPACGSPVLSEAGHSELQRSELRAQIESANAELVQAGADAAESAYGIGCSLGTLAGGLILVLLFLFGMRNWIILAMVFFGAALITTLVATILASKARRANISSAYQVAVNPKIGRYLRGGAHSRQEFDNEAADLLEMDAPLRSYITPENKPAETEQ